MIIRACAVLGALWLAAGIVRAQSGAPDSIIADGVPPIPGELSEALEKYAGIRSASFQGWAGEKGEDGILITTRFADTAQVHWVQKPGGDRKQLTFLKERVLAADPRPKRSELVYSTDIGGAENFQLFLRPLGMGDAVLLTKPGTRNLSPAWSSNGDLLAWASNARNGRDMDIRLMGPSDPKSGRILHEAKGSWSVGEFSPDGKRVAVTEYISANESYIHVIEIATGTIETLTPRPKAGEETSSNTDPKWSPNGESLYWISDQDSEFRRLVGWDRGDAKPQARTSGSRADVEDYVTLDSSAEAAPVLNIEGRSLLMRDLLQGDLSGHKEINESIGAAAGAPITGLRFDPQRLAIGFTKGDFDAPGEAYSVAFGENPTTLERWTESELGGLDPDSFVKPELVKYKSFDEREIPAFVYRPKGAKGKTPALISIHGGPESQFRPAFLGRMNYFINELGITLICPNVRGSSGYGKTYLKLDNGKKREDSVKDIGALLDWIGKQDDMDASRIGVMGGSYGGYMVLACLTHYPDRIKAGVDVVGISNWVSFLENTQSYRRDLRRAEYGDERDPEMRKFLEAISPLTNAAKIKSPLLVAQGKNDPRVPIGESDQIVKAVRQNNVPVWYIVAKDEGHGFAKKKNQDYLQAAEAMFLKQYLLK